MVHVAKLFKNGRSQAVRLPAAYRFEGTEVFISRDLGTGDVILSSKPANWDGFFELLKVGSVPDDFLKDRDEGQAPPPRDPFHDWVE